jgi:hypothetical protein
MMFWVGLGVGVVIAVITLPVILMMIWYRWWMK